MPKLETPDDAAPQPPTSRKIPLPRNPRTPEEINAFFPPPSDAAPPQPPAPPPPSPKPLPPFPVAPPDPATESAEGV